MSVVSILVSLTLCGVVQATVLTGADGEDNAPVAANHGSNVQETPHVALTWAPTGGEKNARNQWEQYNNWPNGGPGGDVYQVDGTVEHTIIFTPEAGYSVILASLDLNVWSGGEDTNVNWTVTGSQSGLLGSGTFFTPDGSAVTHPINLAGNGSETLTLSLLQTSGDDAFLAMDNLTFSEKAVPVTPNQLKILSFNVWTVDDTQNGRTAIADIVRASGADVVGFQELSHAAEVAASLGWHLHPNSARSILSRFPIAAASPGGQGVRIELPCGARAWVFNVHLPAYPYQPYDLRDGTLAKNEAAVITAANSVRGAQVTSVLNDIAASGAMNSGDMVFLTGDFNEPSCLDWTEAAVSRTGRTYDLKVEWPASKRVIDAGLKDSLRTIRPDEVNDCAYTWTPIPSGNEVHDRIDFVYFAGYGVTPVSVQNIGPVGSNPNTDIEYPGYPSDHRAVLATFTFLPPLVDAGGSIITTLELASPPNTLPLAGSVSDDATGPFMIQWEAFETAPGSGPTANVVFADPTDPGTLVTISQPGTYVLKLTATDSNGSFSDQMEVAVFEDACQAKKATGTWVANYYDRNEDCVVDMEDFTIMAAEWLNSTALTESFVVQR